MTEERAKLTVNAEQATRLRCLDNKRKHGEGAIYDPLSGVTLKPTYRGAQITVPRGKNYSGLLRLGAMNLFTVASGKLESTPAEVVDVTLDSQGRVEIEFSSPVMLTQETAVTDLFTIGCDERHGVSLESSSTDILQATTIATMDFAGFTVTNPGDGQLLFVEDTIGAETIAVATVAGTGTLAVNTATQAVAGKLDITLNGDFVATDSIAILGQTITFYATDADLTTAADAYGLSLETSTTAALQAAAISAMTFTGFVVTNPGDGQVCFTQAVAGTGALTVAVVTGTGTLATNAATAAAAGQLALTLNADFAADDTLTVLGETVTFYATDADLLAALEPLNLSAAALPAEPENNYGTIKTFDVIVEDLGDLPEISIRLGNALARFKDQNDVVTPLVVTPFTITLT